MKAATCALRALRESIPALAEVTRMARAWIALRADTALLVQFFVMRMNVLFRPAKSWPL